VLLKMIATVTASMKGEADLLPICRTN